MPKDEKERKRVIVEETTAEEQKVSGEAASDTQEAPVAEIKEKVEELQTLTEDISDSADKSAQVQEQIVEATEKVKQNVEPPTPSLVQRKSGPNILLILIPGVLLLGALLGGIVFYQRSISQTSSPSATPLATFSPSATPTAFSSAQIDLTKYAINVENGSGIPGTAGEAKDILVKAGFSVSATGNAASYNFTKTVIQTKSDVPDSFLTKLSDTLSKTYVLDKNQTLPDTSTDEVIVIVGSSKVQ